MSKSIFLSIIFLCSVNTFACRMTLPAMHQKTVINAVNSINTVNELIKKIEVDNQTARVTFLREIVGSVFCVEKEISFNINADCSFEPISEKELFIEAQDCDYLK